MIDLHLHTTASDGTLSPANLVLQARAAGLEIISITDHDTTAGCDAALRAARDSALHLVPGIEISAVADARDVHVLGYFIDTASASLRAFLARQQEDRVHRVIEMAEKLAGLGCAVDVSSILEEAARGRSVGRPHIADALASAGHVQTRNEAFERFIGFDGAAYVPRVGASPAEVVAIIHEAGGVASLAHPGVTARDELIRPLAAAGLDAIEVRHSDHDAAAETKYRVLAGELGLLVTGGSDYHGECGHRAGRLGTIGLPSDDFDRLATAAARR